MKNFYAFIILLALLCSKAGAQVLPYGKIDRADFKLNSCDFDKGANAMVLFDVAKITYNKADAIIMERHKRIKIFNDNGKKEADIRLEFLSASGAEEIKDLQAQTINLTADTIQITPIDKKLIYNEKIDKQRRAFVFTLPNVRAGSVIEIKYTWKTPYSYNYPDWLFQDLLPTRYSELDATTSFRYNFNIIKKVTQSFAKDTAFMVKNSGMRNQIWGLKNIPGFRLEPYMHSVEDNFQGIYFKPARRLDYWDAIASQITTDEDFGGQLKLALANEGSLMADAKALPTNEEKINFLFNTVKNTIKWNGVNRWFAEDGVKKAWLNKTGNSTEINLILYHFLKLAGIKTTLLVLGSRDHGEIEVGNPSFGRLNKTVVRVPLDSLNYYVMDASGKYNTYNTTPYELLGLNMLTIDPETKGTDIIQLKTSMPSTEVVFVRAGINSSGKLEGNVQKTCSNYKRTSKLELFDNIGKKKYIDDELKEGNSGLEISAHAFFNMETDTLPLREDFNFKADLPSSDENYIYFNPNLFTGLGQNPFIAESRLTDVDFIFLNKYVINGRYQVPQGYKIDVMPKPLTIVMPDNSITFKRVVGEFEGAIIVNYAINLNKTRFAKTEYEGLRAFYKKMFEMLNEQIVLKKG